MRSLRAALAASLAALALLAGCSDDDPSPGDPGSTSTPTGNPETPTSSATAKPTEPALPDAATKATEAGARAFITYYWDLINYAQATGDVKALKRVSGPNCDACTGINDRLHDQYAKGGHVEGGTNSSRVLKASELTTASESAYGFRIRAEVSHDEQTIYDGDGTADQRAAGTDIFVMVLFWSANDSWRLDVMQVD
ncbi:hypothetical protein BJ993_004825 [Nocardioides aromaticivorans]|uniref:DUF6318 domain-containing protein n=1 Tax=Nocardioides aromaticivorans TaxID=200618 RepID=A0A7Z0CR75_9ACTN|nr:DUF6318 family protein [Nocardioides aromaticivorans]NYI47745.1 hypothetical protein [Nocardioides aromaticivorans]